jgi:predicted metalloprotease with PDZ domain
MPTPPLRYTITPKQPEAHVVEVSCTVRDPDPAGQRFALPAWSPGSYMIREFARHVIGIRAHSGRHPVEIVKTDKHTWVAAPITGPLTVIIEVYAWDLSVRAAHLDPTHGFFNGPALFLRVAGKEARLCELEIQPPRASKAARYRRWRVATAMKRHGAPAYGFGAYRAADYDELIDHPIELGTFVSASFRACGARHEVVVTGRAEPDLPRLCGDLKRLCESHIRLFGEPPPMDRYTFLVTAVGEGYGGLEHRASTALLCSRDDLPRPGAREIGEGYRTFLGLCSHEYFHAWNVKRIKPAAFSPYDLGGENYTRMLWAFEGITSYYDDLQLVRAGLIAESDYLELLGRSITSLLRTPGTRRQTLEEASFDAWIKYYRQDENSPNAQVSYYLKGSLVALCLDFLIRQRTRGRKSLDDVMRGLWERYGRTGTGVPEDGVEKLATAVAGSSLRAFFGKALRSTDDLPLRSLLASVGIDLELRPAASSLDKGGKPAGQPARRPAPRVALGTRGADDPVGMKLTHVLDAGAAQAAGLSAGDTIVAIDGLKVGARTLDQRLTGRNPGDVVRVHAFRRDELMEFTVELRAVPADTCTLVIRGSDRTASERRRRWLSDREA